MRRILALLVLTFLIGSMLHAVELRGELVVVGLDISPNPFSTETVITVNVSHSIAAEIVISDCQGTVVRHIYAGLLSAGYHQFVWEGKNDAGEILPSGKYSCDIAGKSKFTSVKKFVILK